MGCDIHLFKEKKVNGQWVTADDWSNEEDELYCERSNYGDRNYNLFGFISKGTRRHHEKSFDVKGMPSDASAEVKKCCEAWGADGHSHSYLTIGELKAAFEIVKNDKATINGMMHRDQWAKVQEEAKKPEPNWMVIYPYCQSTNMSEYVNFSIDVPMSFILGSGIEEIIAGFDGIEAEDLRIVFWFDN